ncbi:MAG: hypothetical protein RLZZ400_520, partial [Actinomycetota bacterium]
LAVEVIALVLDGLRQQTLAVKSNHFSIEVEAFGYNLAVSGCGMP